MSKCNRKLQDLNQARIEKCNNKNFDELAYIFKYEGIIRKKLIEYKFYEAGYLYKTFEKILIKNKKIINFIKKYDIIIPVPIHKNRKKYRGYNQTELIARLISEDVGILCKTNIIEKVVNSKPQSTLDSKNRKINVKNVYKLNNEENVKGKNILLIDDIYTTGSTVNECSRILKLANPNKIGVLIIAKD